MASIIQNLKDIVEVYGSSLPVVFVVALVVSWLGVYVVLNRVVFIGITLSEVAAAGIAVGLIFHFSPLFWGAVFSILTVSLLWINYERLGIPRDSVLGIFFLLGGSSSILLVSKSSFGLEKVKSILYGNILFAGTEDLKWLLITVVPAFLFLLLFYRPLLYSFLDEEFSRVSGVPVRWMRFFFFFFLGMVVSVASKMAGVTLVFSYLVLFPSLALLLVRKMGWVFIMSVLTAFLITSGGIYTSYVYDWPPNQSIAVLGGGVFLLVLFFRLLKNAFA